MIKTNNPYLLATGIKTAWRAASSVPVTPFGSTDGSFEKDRIEKGPGIIELYYFILYDLYNDNKKL